jgi:hypothetical protein
VVSEALQEKGGFPESSASGTEGSVQPRVTVLPFDEQSKLQIYVVINEQNTRTPEHQYTRNI